MTRDEHKAAIQKLIGMVHPDRQGEASELLTHLSEDYEETLTTSEANASRAQELTANNETLRRVNSELFLKVGNSKPHFDTAKKETDTPPDEPDKVPTFEELFNEKGELK